MYLWFITLFHPATTTITSVLLLFSVVLFPFIFFSLLYFSLWYYFKRYAGFLFFNSHFFFENCHFSFLANQAGIWYISIIRYQWGDWFWTHRPLLCCSFFSWSFCLCFIGERCSCFSSRFDSLGQRSDYKWWNLLNVFLEKLHYLLLWFSGMRCDRPSGWRCDPDPDKTRRRIVKLKFHYSNYGISV